MRVSRLLALFCSLALVSNVGLTRAENIGEVLISQSTIERHGLTRAWFAQLPLAGMQSKIVSIVPDDDLLLITTTTADVLAVDAETGRLVWSAQVGDPRQPTFPPGSNGQPAFRATHWKLLEKPKPGAPAKAPADATAPADAASGAGDAQNPAPAGDAAPAAQPAATTIAPAAAPPGLPANNLVVGVVNGTTLYLLDRVDGRIHMDEKSKQPWRITLRNLPKNGPMITDTNVYVPTANGHIETYPINDLHAGVTYVTSAGRNLYPPVVSGQRVAWISDRGIVNITLPDRITPKYEVDLSGSSQAQIAVHPPFIFAGNDNGDVFCVRETEGAIVWKLPTGSPIREAPICVRDMLFAMPEGAGLSSISAATGLEQWTNSAVRKFLAASPSKAYASDRWNRLLVIDAKSGGTLDTIAMPTDVRPLTNIQTDRVYFYSDSGMLQCLHEILLTAPEYYPAPVTIAQPKPAPVVVVRPKPAADDADKPKPEPVPVKPKKKPDADNPPVVKPKKPAKGAAN